MAVTGTGPKILVVDDEDAIRRLVSNILLRENYDVLVAACGREALDFAAKRPPDLVVLDLSLPNLGGLEVCRELRSWSTVPILVLSARSDHSTKAAALDLGADDYLTKPFASIELLARVRALLRRAASHARSPKSVQAGDLEIELAGREVRMAGRPVHLTPTEFEILGILARNANHVVKSESIVHEIWGPESSAREEALRVHMGNLRKKIERDPSEPRYILTEPSVGYRFSTD